MKHQKRVIALILCLFFILLLFFSSALIAGFVKHDCIGETCLTCELLTEVSSMLNFFSLLGLVLVFPFPLLNLLQRKRSPNHFLLSLSQTPVRWKVRLND